MPEQSKSFFDHVVDTWSADNTKEGYEQGLKDAMAGKTSLSGSYWHMRKFNLLYGFDQAAATYSDAYKKGYIDGERKRNEIYSGIKEQSYLKIKEDVQNSVASILSTSLPTNNTGDADNNRRNNMADNSSSNRSTGSATVGNAATFNQLAADVFKVRQEIWTEFTDLKNDIADKANNGGWNDPNYQRFAAAFDVVWHGVIGAFDEHGPFAKMETHLKNCGLHIDNYKQQHPVPSNFKTIKFR